MEEHRWIQAGLDPSHIPGRSRFFALIWSNEMGQEIACPGAAAGPGVAPRHALVPKQKNHGTSQAQGPRRAQGWLPQSPLILWNLGLPEGGGQSSKASGGESSTAPALGWLLLGVCSFALESLVIPDGHVVGLHHFIRWKKQAFSGGRLMQ